MPSLWYTLMRTSTDKMFNLLLMTSSEKCAQCRVYFYKSEKLRIFDHRLNLIITGLVRVHLLPSTSPHNRRLPTIYYITTFSIYKYFHNCYYYLNTYFFLVLHEGTSATTGATSPLQQGSKLPRFYNSYTFFTSWRL